MLFWNRDFERLASTGCGLVVCLVLAASCSKQSDVNEASNRADADTQEPAEKVEMANLEPVEEPVSIPAEAALVDERKVRLREIEDKLQTSSPKTWKEELALFLGELSDRERRDVLGDLAVSLAAKSPDSARKLVLALADRAEGQAFATKVAMELIEKDTLSSRGWVEGFQDPALRLGTAAALARSWSRRDSGGVLDWLESIEDAPLREAVLDGLIWGWAQSDRTKAYEWVQTLEDRTDQDAALLKLTKMVALKDPPSAAGWVLAFPESAARVNGLRFALHRWSRDSLTEAMQWVSELEDPELFREGTLTIARIWAKDEPRAVTRWAEALPELMRENAFEVVVDEWGRTDPLAVIHWAQGIEDGGLKSGLLRRVGSAWKQRDGDGFAEWKETLSDPELKSHFGE